MDENVKKDVNETSEVSVKRKSSSSIEDKLMRAELLIKGSAADEEIKLSLKKYGFGEEKLVYAAALLNEVKDLFLVKENEKSGKKDAVESFNKMMDSINETYVEAVKLARIAFKNNKEIYSFLGLSGKREGKYALWIVQLKSFYRNALSRADIIDVLSQYNISEETLRLGLRNAEDIETERIDMEREKSESVTSTNNFNKKLKELEGIISDLKKIALIALKNNPGWLKRLGL